MMRPQVTHDYHPSAQVEICSATLSYFGPNVARRLRMKPEELRAKLGDRPLMSSLMETPLGNVAVVTVPMTFVDMIRDRRLAVDYGQAALDMVRAMGARHVSQSGLLASALDYGALLDAPEGMLTTGHATTAASILLTVEAVLTRCGRTWRSEAVGVLGVGSIGQTTIAAAIEAFGLPHQIVLSDLVSKRAEITGFAGNLRAMYPGLDVSFVDAGRHGPGPLYESSLIVGSTSTPGVLRIELIPPGSIVVDDSVPHCFNVNRAFARAAATKDVIVANGGAVRFPEPFPSTSYLPTLLRDALNWPTGIYRSPDITSCILSPLLMARHSDLPATLGKSAPVAAVQAFATAMDAHAITAPPIRCGGRTLSSDYLDQFAERFGDTGAS